MCVGCFLFFERRIADAVAFGYALNTVKQRSGAALDPAYLSNNSTLVICNFAAGSFARQKT